MKILLLSDIHANLAALEAVLEEASATPYDAIWCLGDLVGYGPHPNECIEALRSQRAPLLCVAGNHDWASLGKVSLEDFNPDARLACQWTMEQLTPENQDYLLRLPVSAIEGNYTLVHGSPRQPIWEYILYPSLATANFVHFQTPCCLVGHTHIPVVFEATEPPDDSITLAPSLNGSLSLAQGRFIVNPGSVGQPRDGDPRASYAILNTEDRELQFRRVDYPVEVTQEKMLALALPPRLIARLSYGW